MDLVERISRLSPQQRKLLEVKLKKQNIDFLKIPIFPVDREMESAFPLSREQEQLWIIEQFDPDQTAYVIISAARIEGIVDVGALEGSVARIADRHESLRTRIVVRDQRPVQVVDATAPVSLVFKTIEGPSLAFQVEKVKSILREEVLSSFDLATGPLFKTLLFQLSENKHIFLALFHHIIADGTSVLVFLEELAHFYWECTAQREVVLPPLPIQYVDYACWQKTWFGDSASNSRSRIEQENYWLAEMAGELPVLELPTDFLRPAIQSFKGNSIHFRLSAGQTRALKRMALEEKTTTFNLILAMFYILLSRLGNTEDVLLGTPLAGRRQAQVQKLIGMFVKTLVLRNYPEGSKMFGDFLREVTQKTVRAFENQEYQYEDLVRKIMTGRDISRNPLFDVMFAFYNMDFNKVQVPGLALTPFEFEYQTAKFDLSLLGFESGDSMFFSVEYCTELFQERTVRRFIEYFKEIVSSLLETTDRRIADIPIIPEAEKRRLLLEFNDTFREYPDLETVHRGIFQQAAASPDRVALVFGENQICYGPFAGRIAGRAVQLKERGLVTGNPVGLLMERSVELMISIFGTLAAGGMYVPIDPEFPAGRIDCILKTSGVNLLIVGDRGAAPAGFTGEIFFAGAESSGRSDEYDYAPADLAYCIFTSGSTGNPKGVVIRHRSILNYCHSLKEQLQLERYRSVLCLTTISFDIFVTESFVALLNGMRIVLADEMQQKDPVLQKKLILRAGVDMVQMTPSRLKLLLAEEKTPSSFGGVRLYMSGGEILPQHLADEAKGFFSGELVNLYGPTETTVYSSLKNLTGVDRVTIGAPIGNTVFYVVGAGDSLQPIGVPGELLIGGDGLAAGYLNNPTLTAEKFIKNPFLSGASSGRNSDMLYRSGDLVRWLDTGELEFLGRIDFQVKIRGFRVELEEIEEALLKHQWVEQAIVTAGTSSSGERFLCAYYVSSEPGLPVDDGELNVTAIRDFLAGSLPAYMIPAYFVKLDTIPLTQNKKIDWKALPDPVAKSGKSYVAPGSELERQLAEAWSVILGIEASRIGIHDNFFELGGNSFELIRLRMQISASLGEELAAVTLFQYPTIHALCGYLSRNRMEETSAAESPLSETGDSTEDLVFDAIQAFEEE